MFVLCRVGHPLAEGQSKSWTYSKVWYSQNKYISLSLHGQIPASRKAWPNQLEPSRSNWLASIKACTRPVFHKTQQQRCYHHKQWGHGHAQWGGIYFELWRQMCQHEAQGSLHAGKAFLCSRRVEPNHHASSFKLRGRASPNTAYWIADHNVNRLTIHWSSILLQSSAEGAFVQRSSCNFTKLGRTWCLTDSNGLCLYLY